MLPEPVFNTALKSTRTTVLLMLALAQVCLLADLVTGLQWAELVAEQAGGLQWLGSSAVWLLAHGLTSLLATHCIAHLLQVKNGFNAFKLLIFSFTLLIPFAGCLGSYMALGLGAKFAALRHREPDHWIITRRAELPFTTPSGRKATRIDGRGFAEHLMYSDNDGDLYRKVLSAANMSAALSVSALKEAMRHKDERIRLTAYKLLDRKVSELNRQIQQLEEQVANGNTLELSNSWLQIASNYWELLTLEKGEPVARQQLLEKAAAAARQATEAMPVNRNAHFVLGRVLLLQGDTRHADVSFTRAKALGMPTDKVMPYLAEAAFMRHDFKQVRELLKQLNPAIRAYPPLSHVAEYWT